MNLTSVQQKKSAQLLLTPLSWIYGSAMAVRNWMYDRNMFKLFESDIPLISIGNITAGGAGKTPLTMYLIEQLQPEFGSLAVVSRGYGRRSKGTVVVSDGAGKIVPADQGGDEPVLIARRYQNIPVVVSERREHAIKEVLRRFKVNCILMDDAFQHRRVSRDCDIVLLPAFARTLNDKVLPAGYLREPLLQLRRASVVITTGTAESENEKSVSGPGGFFSGPVFHSSTFCGGIVDRHLKRIKDPDRFRGQKAVAFAGIARPRSLQDMLRAEGIELQTLLEFGDHHRYRRPDYERIKRAADEADARLIFTTEKDLVKLQNDYLRGFEVLAPRLEINLEAAANLIQIIKDCIDKAYQKR